MIKILRQFRAALLFAGLTLALSASGAESWMRGAVAITRLAGDVELQETGGRRIASDTALPLYLPGLIQARTGNDGEIFLLTSGGVAIEHEGPGYFEIERFDQQAPEADAGREVAVRSRMILSLRSGRLVVDNRTGEEQGAAPLVLETPMGRISVNEGLWTIRLFADRRGKQSIHTFEIECVDGLVRFTDRRGKTYTLQGGHRLSGAGSPDSPSIEVTDWTESVRKRIQEFSGLLRMAEKEGVESEKLTAAIRPMPVEELDFAYETGRGGLEEEETDASQPIFVDYVPRADLVSPFRGVVRPPLKYDENILTKAFE
ncbi:MAG: hypothetical protein ACLFUF_06490 [Opitutales bacterium]